MSEYSYQINVQRGVTGPNSSSCLLASFDRISERAEISPQTYVAYKKLRNAYVEVCPDDNNANYVPTDITEQYRTLTKTFYKELGVATMRNVVHQRADTEEELGRLLGRLSAGGFRLCAYLDTGGLHAVGLTPAGEGLYEVKSTWSPFPEGEPTSVSDIFAYLDRAPRVRKRENCGKKTDKTSNITAIPAEPRQP